MTAKRTFDQTRRLAKHLGEKIKLIEDKMPWSRDLAGKGKHLLGIAEALTVIAEAPNASINETALDAFGKFIDEAIESVKAWGKELFTLSEHDPIHEDDEIAF